MTTKKLKEKIKEEIRQLENISADTVFIPITDDNREYFESIDKAIIFYKDMLTEIEFIENKKGS